MSAVRLRLNSIPILGGGALGLAAAALVGTAPSGWIESVADAGGIAGFISAARPPLGATARLLLAAAAGAFTGATVWSALFLLFGPGGAFGPREREKGMPGVRRADAHPDAPPRRPLVAAELGSPPTPVSPDKRRSVTDRGLPIDLDQPLAAFDPAAMRLAPMEPGRPVPPLAIKREPLAPGERFESVELPSHRPEEVDAPSIESLLARLERGARAKRRIMRAG